MMRDKLIEIMQDWGTENTDSFPFESVADYLIAKGVIVPSCNTSDVVRDIFEEIEEVLDDELCKEDERERIAWMESDMREHAIHHYAGDKIETLMTAFDLLKKKYESEAKR